MGEELKRRIRKLENIVEGGLERGQGEGEGLERLFPGISEYLSKPDANNALVSLQTTLLALRAAKPDERSETARRYAVTITEMEKVVAYFKMYVVDDTQEHD